MANHWAESVRSVIADLESINRESEAGFLAVGNELAGFLSISARISYNAGAIAELISGEQGQHQCDALQRLLNQIQHKENRTRLGQQIHNLREMATRIRRCFCGFEGKALAFKHVSILGRIEIGRLDRLATGLSQLTTEMQSCSEDMQSRVAQFLDTARLLDSHMDSLFNGIVEFEDRETKALPPLVKTIGISLEGFRTHQQRSERAARALGAQFADLSRSLGDVVMSMQAHDITHQQIEHVSAALVRLSAESGESPCRALGPHEARVVDLQLAQLENSAETFEVSITAIDLGLATIAARTEDMVVESAALMEQSPHDSESVFGEMQQSLTAIVQATRNCEALERGEQSALMELADTIHRLAKALVEIEAIGLNLRLLALNTVIQARQLGMAGEPLKAVAGTVRELQLHCEANSREGSLILGEIDKAISILGREDEIGPAVEELGSRINELKASASCSIAACQDIGPLADTLCSDLRRTRESFAVSRVLHKALERCCQTLRLILSDCASREGQPVAGDWLTEHANKYTMHSQRDVHERVLGRFVREEASSVCGEVELF